MSKNIRIPYVKTPCKDCPFRKDIFKGWLGKDRADELVNDTDSFICHKTSNLKDNLKKQCAGHMILMENENLFVRIMKARKDDINLKGKSLVFDNKDDFIKHHEW